MNRGKEWTNEEDIYMANNYGTENWDALKHTLNRSEKSIRSRAHVLGLTRETQQYALYKGENLLGIGTAKDLAEQEGVKELTIRYYLSNSYKKRSEGIKIPSNRRVLVKI